MYKILVVTGRAEETLLLEETFYSLVEAGIELFFAATKDYALVIMELEQPQLIFCEGVLDDAGYTPHIVSIVDKVPEGAGDFLCRPLQAAQLLEKCYAFFDVKKIRENPLPL